MKQKYKINSTRKIDGKMNLSIELHYVLELTFSVYIDNCPLVNSAAPPPQILHPSYVPEEAIPKIRYYKDVTLDVFP